MTEESNTKGGTGEQGVVEEVLPNAMFQVHLDDGRVVRANIASALKHAIVRLITGSRVVVKLSAHDPHRGQITKLL